MNFRKLLGSKRYADYMRRFHVRDDGKQTNIHRVAETLWYAILASGYKMSVSDAGYSEENDTLDILIDGKQYELTLSSSGDEE